MTQIPFNVPYIAGTELPRIAEALKAGKLSGDGAFTKRCKAWLEEKTGCREALIVHSCTAALEMGAMLMDIRPGDEVIMPSYTFVSTANAVVLRGGVPVFVDIREDTLNIDETLIEGAITPRTKGIVPVHYAGVGCEMDAILAIAGRHKLHVMEDAAQGLLASYKGRPLGTLGDSGAISFHETKNIISGEGGALLINRQEDTLKGEILREKGTDRSRFFRGEVDKYTWQDAGSSYLPAEIVAAFLSAQLEDAERINQMRMDLWEGYHARLAGLEEKGVLRRPVIPAECGHNAHMYYVLLAPGIDRAAVLSGLKQRGISAVFHYIPLHSSPAGKRFCRVHGSMAKTEDLSERLIRLPLWNAMTEEHLDRVTEALAALL
ncbi:MAG: dTDP-4-amino-4,6-dideoxygalactose transaminase [Desulfovibrionaceae bacterium]|nr:dTDP-4-amino-4,6-dideoxygalactose transaminase [Desulfovibrionaceae bacterium]